MNPPYAEASNAGNTGLEEGDENKTGVAASKINTLMKASDFGYAGRELFVQFMARIAKEIPTATLAMFSTLKYVNAPNFSKFRAIWNAKYLGGFIIPCRVFDGLTGNFPIGFLIWKTDQGAAVKTPIKEITVEVTNAEAAAIGEKKFYNLPNSSLLTGWIPRLKTDAVAIPLKNAVSPQLNKVKVDKWVSGAIGYMYCNSNDVQHAGQQTVIYSSVYAGGNGYYITKENLSQIAVVFAVRLSVKHKWSNHNDQFLKASEPLTEEFKNDCLIFMLFHGKNCTAAVDNLEYKGEDWSLVNHFIPFTET